MSFSGRPAGHQDIGFNGRPTAFVDQIITNDGFWPDLSLAEFQRVYRMPAEFLADMLADSLRLAMLEVNLDLAARRRQWQREGIDALATADTSVLPDAAAFVASYKRAVYTRAKAHLLPQFATVNRRAEAENLAKDAPETRDLYLAFSQQAVRLIQKRGRITAALV